MRHEAHSMNDSDLPSIHFALVAKPKTRPRRSSSQPLHASRSRTTSRYSDATSSFDAFLSGCLKVELEPPGLANGFELVHGEVGVRWGREGVSC